MQPQPRNKLLRLAVKLQAAFDKQQQGTPAFDLPDETWTRCQQLAKHMRQARFFNWQTALSRRRKELDTALDQFRLELQDRQRQLDTKSHRLASLRDLLLDLAVLYQDFDHVEFDLRAGTLSVTTEPITLDEQYLGEFAIELEWKRLESSRPYRILALDAHSAARDSTVTHPHVQEETLCEGDGGPAIRAALASGRLYDFFCLIANVLRTYNSSSAYVTIDEWSGSSCSNCGSHCDDDESITCSRCEDRVCDDCSYCCHVCGDYHCSGCSSSCSACQESTCTACLGSCNQCDESVCNSCLTENNLCENCHEHESETPDELASVEAA